MKRITILFPTIIASAAMLLSIQLQARSSAGDLSSLRTALDSISASYPAEIGVALLSPDGDTVVVNNEDKYPLMSVFKLHQAIALCKQFDETRTSSDTLLTIRRDGLNLKTWSPMLDKYKGDTISVTALQLLCYTLTLSDNNASNYLFSTIQTVDSTDKVISEFIPRSSFRLAVTEDEMFYNHTLCHRNHSSPLGAAMLMNRLFTDSAFNTTNYEFVRTMLRECRTGADRIAAPFAGRDNVTITHKTGSGFRTDDGILSAQNDVARITLPDGRSYVLCVLVKDFHGTDAEASTAIAAISATVLRAIE